MLPPAPGLFSMMKGCLKRSDRRCARLRAMMSVVPPAVNATTTFTGRFGYGCAKAALVQDMPNNAIAIHQLLRSTVAPPAFVGRSLGYLRAASPGAFLRKRDAREALRVGR